MNSNGILGKHWLHVSLHFVLDAAIFMVAFCMGIALRLGETSDASFLIGLTDQGHASLGAHWPALAMGAFALSCAVYILGFYSTHSARHGIFRRSILLLAATVVAVLTVLGVGYLEVVVPIGRGIVAIAAGVAYGLILVHHAYILHALKNVSERFAYIVASPFDEAEAKLLKAFSTKNLEFVGIIAACGYQPKNTDKLLGTVDHLEQIVRSRGVERVLVTTKSLGNQALTKHFCKLRYSGVTVMPLILMCEEIEQNVPLELVTPDWLLNASGEPHLFYIKKVKRLFDIVFASIGLVLGGPVLLAAMLAVRLTSRGPIFYKQVRAGRFGRPFEMCKLRTMRVDAEKNGAQWSQKNDPRVTPVGGFMRKYRIDEIPQLWNVLCGHMSFVGPRPERPEMITQIARDVPYFEERLMVQPGITGWAQVCYPYGASIEDTKRKLEYDLYYMKHMSISLDAFILLDTVRIVLSGGVTEVRGQIFDDLDELAEWRRLKTEDAAAEIVRIAAKSA